jgi:hypothetical protein
LRPARPTTSADAGPAGGHRRGSPRQALRQAQPAPSAEVMGGAEASLAKAGAEAAGIRVGRCGWMGIGIRR